MSRSLWPPLPPGVRAYVLVGRRAGSENVPANLPVVPLWYGAPPPELAPRVPRLVAVTPGEAGSDALAQDVQNFASGLLITSRLDLDALRRHLHRFAMARGSSGVLHRLHFDDPLYFRELIERFPATWLNVLFAEVETIACAAAEHPAVLMRYGWNGTVLRRDAVHVPTGIAHADELEPAPEPPREPPPEPAPAPPGRLVIRPEQVEALDSDRERDWIGLPFGETARRFIVRLTTAMEDRLRAVDRKELEQTIRNNLHAFHPEVISKVMASDLTHMIRTAIARAEGHGLRATDAVFGFVKLMFLIAPNFDEHPKVRELLGRPGRSPEQAFEAIVAAMTTAEWAEAQRLADNEAWALPELESD